MTFFSSASRLALSMAIACSVVAAVGISCGGAEATSVGAAPGDTVAIPASRTVAFVGANVLAMRTSAIDARQTVIVQDGRIAMMGPEASTAVPGGAYVVDAHGAYLMPGLVDMHVHNAIRDAALYVPAGITTVRNMWGFPGLLEYARRVQTERLRVPTIVAVSPGVDGHPASWPYTRFVENPAFARDSIRTVLGEGWSAIKIYDHLPAATYDSVIAVAHAAGIRVIGHVPFAIPVARALAAGQDEIEHLSGYQQAVMTRAGPPWSPMDETRIPDLVARTVSARAWNCPTLAIISELSRQSAPASRDDVVRNRRRFVKALFDGGARLLIGSDSGIDVVPAGATIHTELAEFVAAGISPYETLRIATRGAAEALGVLADVGTIEPGRRADLLLVDRNPFADIANVTAMRGVMLRGEWIPRAVLGR
jgi:imidazolonepropionase-like amidohydrolase